MTAPRQVLPGSFYSITRRTTQRQLILRPDEETNNCFTYCLAEAAQEFGIDVLMTYAASNHHHTDVFDRYGYVIEFVHRFHKLFATAQNAFRGRWENLWASEPPCIVRLEDPGAVIDAIVYSAINPVKDGLVERVHQWPGVNGLSALLEGQPLGATRPDFFRTDGPMPEAAVLRLALPPELGDPEAIKDEIRERVAREEERLAIARRASGRSVLGRVAILRQSWRTVLAGTEPRRGLRPRVAARHLAARLFAFARARAFREAYQTARARLLAGLEAVFPPGTYWLRRFAAVRVAPFQIES